MNQSPGSTLTLVILQFSHVPFNMEQNYILMLGFLSMQKEMIRTWTRKMYWIMPNITDLYPVTSGWSINL
jgi:hypothetical protein